METPKQPSSLGNDPDFDRFDRLFAPEAVEPLPIEAAAVRLPRVPAVAEVMTDEDEANRDARLRERIPQSPLTPNDIAALGVHRGQAVSPAEVAGMNAVREAGGLHTSVIPNRGPDGPKQ